MLNAFLFGLLSTSSLLLGAIIASRFSLSNRAIGIIMGFGAGTLISAVSYELVFEAVKTATRSGYPAYGLFTGALVFFLAEKIISNFNQKKSAGKESSGPSSLIIPMVLAIILDGIPESIVLGLGLYDAGSVSLAMLVAIFISNLPEAIAGTSGMKKSGWGKLKIVSLWLFIALFCAFASLAGFTLFAGASHEWMAFIHAFAGGAILMMLANSMIPEAYEYGGKLAGVFTVLGFFVSVVMIVFENSQNTL